MVFLASSASQYVCGELLVVDGVSTISGTRFGVNLLVYFYFLGMDGPVIVRSACVRPTLDKCKSRTVMKTDIERMLGMIINLNIVLLRMLKRVIS
jgi:hypothetical protein